MTKKKILTNIHTVPIYDSIAQTYLQYNKNKEQTFESKQKTI